MATALKIIFGILIGIGVVCFWPVIVGVVYIVAVAIVTVLAVAGQFLLYISTIFFLGWLAYVVGKHLFCRKHS